MGSEIPIENKLIKHNITQEQRNASKRNLISTNGNLTNKELDFFYFFYLILIARSVHILAYLKFIKAKQ